LPVPLSPILIKGVINADSLNGTRFYCSLYVFAYLITWSRIIGKRFLAMELKHMGCGEAALAIPLTPI
jgi:hypothetical protein